MEREEYWDNSEEEIYAEDVPYEGSRPTVFVNGSHIEITAGANFREVCKDVARNSGLGKFRVVLNGNEIVPADAPEVIANGDSIELRKYDIAG